MKMCFPHSTFIRNNVVNIQSRRRYNTTVAERFGRKIPPTASSSMRLPVINFSPPNLINFPSKLMKTRIIQRVRREILSSVQKWHPLATKVSIYHTLYQHSYMTTFAKAFFLPLSALEKRLGKTKFIFSAVHR
jgi:hypothetical protein